MMDALINTKKNTGMIQTIKSIVLLAFFGLLCSCESLLETDPILSVDTDAALNSVEGIEAAAVGSYSYLRDVDLYGREYIVNPELMGNTAAHSGRRSNYLALSNNQRGYHMGGWATAFKGILQINMVLEALEEIESDQEWK